MDGRRQRRERGRQRVIEAMLDLVLEGHAPPSVDQIVERAGVSSASVFRYFATLDELRGEVIALYVERFGELMAVPEIGQGGLADRVARLVAARDAFYCATAPVARLVRRQMAEVDQFAHTLDQIRATLAEQLDTHFAPELEGLAPTMRRQRVAVLAALSSFESWDQLAPLGAEPRRQALIGAIGDLLR